MSRAQRWWNEPDHFEWTTQFLTQRGLLRSTQIVMAVVSASAALVALSFLLGMSWSTVATVAIGLFGAGFTIGLTAFWMTRWPTRRQSEIAIVIGVAFIAVWSILQHNTAVAMLACTATAATGGYIAFFHNARLLLGNFVVGIAIALSASWRLGSETNVATAIAAFWLLWFLNLTVPLAILGTSRAMGTFARRSYADPLTGLFNRRGFADSVSSQLAEASDSETHLTLLMVDLDNFKRVNDDHGHAEGDRALRAVAELLRQRSSRRAAICRAGGEEFLVAVTTGHDGAEPIATELCRAIAELPHLTASIGTRTIPIDRFRDADFDATLEELIAAADAAMYTAKRSGGNQVRLG